MDDRALHRRDLLRAGGALLGTGAVSLAGCTESLPVLGDGGGGDPTAAVPGSAQWLATADVQALLSDQALRQAANEKFQAFSESERFQAVPANVDAALSQLQQAMGLDPRKVDRVTAFGRLSGSPAAVVRANWREDAIESTVRNRLGLSPTSYRSFTAFSHRGTAILLLGDGDLAVGDTDAVHAAADVQAGAADPISGSLATRFEQTNGMIRAAVARDRAAGQSGGHAGPLANVDGLQAVRGSFYRAGSDRGVRAVAVFGEPAQATAAVEQVRAGLEQIVSNLQRAQSGYVTIPGLGGGLVSFINLVTVRQEGRTVRLTAEGKPAVVGVAPVLLPMLLVQTAGFLQSTSEETGERSAQQVTDRLQLVSATGTQIANDAVGQVEVVVKTAPGAGDIDLSGVTIQWIGPSGTYDVVAAGSDAAGADGAFGMAPFKDANDSFPVLDDPDDRATLVLDLGADDPSDATSGGRPFGEALGAGESATLRLVTSSGARSVQHIVVPERLAGKQAVAL